MKKIYLLLVNGLLITSAVGVTALTVAGCNDKKKDDKNKDTVKDKDVKKALEKFKENPLEIDYLKDNDTDAVSSDPVTLAIRTKLKKVESKVFTEEIVKKIKFNGSMLSPGEAVNAEAIYTGGGKITVDIKVKEKYGTKIVKDILAAYTEKNPLKIEYAGNGAKQASSAEVTAKCKKELLHVGLTHGLLKKISFDGTKITPGSDPVKVTPSYPQSQGAIWLYENNNAGSQALSKYAKKEAPLALDHLKVTEETETAANLQDYIRKALKKKGGEKFADVADNITFDTAKLAPGVIVEVKATFEGESTYIYIREDYDVEGITKELAKHKDDAKALEIAYVGADELPITNEGVLKKLEDAIYNLSAVITHAAVNQMSFSGDSTLTPGGSAVTVTVTYPKNTLTKGDYDKKTIDIKVKEKELA